MFSHLTVRIMSLVASCCVWQSDALIPRKNVGFPSTGTLLTGVMNTGRDSRIDSGYEDTLQKDR